MNRLCDSCTLCCEGWLVINSNGIESSLNKPCINLSCNVGCKIYTLRPNDPCGTFKCLWLTDTQHISQEMKPSITNLIFQEKIVHGWHLPVLAVVATNTDSLDLHWEDIKNIAIKKGTFAVALAYSNEKINHTDHKTLKIYGDAIFAETMTTLFNNRVAIF